MKLTFFGGAKEVTGSNYLLETVSAKNSHPAKILIDCGLNQGSRLSEDSNFEDFEYDPSEIDALLITHGHIDHIGRIPKLYKAGFRGRIFSTHPTKDIAEFLLLDSENILEKDAKERNLPPLYTIEDVNKVMELWETFPYRQKFRVKSFEIEFFDAGHVLGSSSIVISSDEGKKIVFSGDLGNNPAPLINDMDIIEGCDYALIESAYGNRIHEDASMRKDLLEDFCEDTFKSKGVLMIPVFAMERTQELLFELNELVENQRIPRVPIFLDSPLAIKLTEVYKKYSQNPLYFNQDAIELMKKGDAVFDFPGLHVALTTEESKEINDVPAPKIIIAGSGMSQGGRILHHEFKYLSDPKNSILFIGYQSEGTLGRRIWNGDKMVRIFGEEIPVRCKMRAIGGYSAHADQPRLLNWIDPMKTSLKKVFIVQGEEEQMIPLQAKIRDNFAIEAVIPEAGQTVELN